MRSANIVGSSTTKRNLDALAAQVRDAAAACDALILPAIIGLNRNDSLEVLRAKIPTPLYLLPTLPPSIPGIRAQQALQHRFPAHSAANISSATACCAPEYDGNSVKRIFTANHGNIPFEADHFVLATGSFFSRGLVATLDRIVEPVFGADTVATSDRSQWYTLRFFEPPEHQAFGVRTDAALHVVREGRAIGNLYGAGAGLAGFHPVQEGCGAGVSLLSALFAADEILNSHQS